MKDEAPGASRLRALFALPVARCQEPTPTSWRSQSTARWSTKPGRPRGRIGGCAPICSCDRAAG